MVYLRRKRSWLPWVLVITVLIITVWLLYALGQILTPFIIAAVLAYILDPLVNRLEARGIKRGLGSMVVMILALLVLFTLILIMVPMLLTQFQNLAERLPQLVAFLQNKVMPWLTETLGDNVLINRDTLIIWLSNHMGMVQSMASKLIPTLIAKSGAMAMGMSNLMLLPLLLYYFLYDWDHWAAGLNALVPRRFFNTYRRISKELDSVLSEFLRGQLMVMLIMGCFYGIGLAMVGLESGFAIGMIAGLLVFIPYLGAFTGMLLATIAAVLQFGNWQGLLLVWSVFGVGQMVESFLITPKIVGNRIGLSPFWVIFSLMAFGQLMGFVGMLVGLPLAAVCLVLLREGAQVYLQSSFYNRK